MFSATTWCISSSPTWHRWQSWLLAIFRWAGGSNHENHENDDKVNTHSQPGQIRVTKSEKYCMRRNCQEFQAQKREVQVGEIIFWDFDRDRPILILLANILIAEAATW